MSKSILRQALVKEIAPELKLSGAKTRSLVLAVENIVANEIKDKGRVQITRFGTFYKRTRPSRVIKTVRGQKSKLLLEKEALKFIASKDFKDVLLNKTRKKPKPKKLSETSSANESTFIPIKINGQIVKKISEKAAQQIEENIEKIITLKPTQKIKLPPLAIHTRVEKDKIVSSIKKRIAAAARANAKSTPLKKELSAAEKIFSRFVRQTARLDKKCMDFSIPCQKANPMEKTTIFAGRPRIIIGHIPTVNLQNYLFDVADLHESSLPQVRFVAIKKDGYDKNIMLEIHSLPVNNGLSVHINLR